MDDEQKKDESKVQADNNSIAVGGINIGGSVGGNITIGHSGYTSDEVSVLITQIKSTFQPKPFDGRSPYKGLDVFDEEDAELFFGREKLVEDKGFSHGIRYRSIRKRKVVACASGVDPCLKIWRT